MNLFRFIPGYEEWIYQAGKEPILFLFLAFLITFALVRFYTRQARKRSWGSGSVGGVHLHHVVIGVILMAVAGILGYTQFSSSKFIYSISAAVFGIGLALTLDEFAMLLHLRDVYWAQEGRTSIDALILGTAGAGLFLVSSSPFTAEGKAKAGTDLAVELKIGDFELKVGVLTALITSVFVAAIVFLKKKPFAGVLALWLLPVGITGAIRLAKPGSPWARWFYEPREGSIRSERRRQLKRERSVHRFTEGRSGRFERWFSDLLGGAPTEPSTAPPEGDDRTHPT